MRVLCVSDLSFREFPELPDADYAILSHVWGRAELSYKDMLNHGPDTRPFYFRGKDLASRKLEGCRAEAWKYGIKYFWIDTCCIDKPNHSEFNEAINSMYHWYKMAKICFVYLGDVSGHEDLSASKWFTRGWTLQELLAPANVWLYNKYWDYIGSKRNTLAPVISSVTKIPRRFLRGASLESASVAERMAWASYRTTTKEEDMAYCLLGIFDVHMPLLYGERLLGAFQRLQLKILELQDDSSIFAWRTPDSMTHTFGLLAPYPSSFQGCHDHVRADLPAVEGYKKGIRTPILFNNKGLHLSLPTRRYQGKDILAILACTKRGQWNKRYAICLRDVSANGGRYVRIRHIFKVDIDTDFMRKARFRNITTEHRLFKKMPAVRERQWVHAQSAQVRPERARNRPRRKG